MAEITTATDPLVGNATGYESSLSSWAGPYVTEMLGRGKALASEPYMGYEGPLTAGSSPLQDTAFSGLASLQTPGAGAADQAGGLSTALAGMSYSPTEFTSGYDPSGVSFTPSTFDTNTMSRERLDQYMNPYLDMVLQPTIAELTRQADIQRLQDAGRLTRAGAYGGSRQAIMESELNRNLLDKIGQATGTAYGNAYTSALGAFDSDEMRRLQAAELRDRSAQYGAGLGADIADTSAGYGLEADKMSEGSRQFGANYGLDALRSALSGTEISSRLGGDAFRNELDRLSAMMAGGDKQRAIESEGIAADLAKFEEERDAPYKQVQFMQSLLNGMPLEAQSVSYLEPSAYSQALGGAGGLMDLLGMIFNKGTSKTNAEA